MKYYLTTPIYYVNATPHIGHAYTTIVADTVKRVRCMMGEEVYLCTGTDEHGQKVERSAGKAGWTPKEFTDRVSAAFRDEWGRTGDRLRLLCPHDGGAAQAYSAMVVRAL